MLESKFLRTPILKNICQQLLLQDVTGRLRKILYPSYSEAYILDVCGGRGCTTTFFPIMSERMYILPTLSCRKNKQTTLLKHNLVIKLKCKTGNDKTFKKFIENNFSLGTCIVYKNIQKVVIYAKLKANHSWFINVLILIYG